MFAAACRHRNSLGLHMTVQFFEHGFEFLEAEVEVGQAALSRDGFHQLNRLAVLVLAGITTVVWAVRGVQIALADHSVGFIVVHTVLALVSIGLAVVAWRAVDGDRPASSTVAAAR